MRLGEFVLGLCRRLLRLRGLAPRHRRLAGVLCGLARKLRRGLRRGRSFLCLFRCLAITEGLCGLGRLLLRLCQFILRLCRRLLGLRDLFQSFRLLGRRLRRFARLIGRLLRGFRRLARFFSGILGLGLLRLFRLLLRLGGILQCLGCFAPFLLRHLRGLILFG